MDVKGQTNLISSESNHHSYSPEASQRTFRCEKTSSFVRLEGIFVTTGFLEDLWSKKVSLAAIVTVEAKRRTHRSNTANKGSV